MIGSHPHRQHDSHVMLNENRGTKNKELVAISKQYLLKQVQISKGPREVNN